MAEQAMSGYQGKALLWWLDERQTRIALLAALAAYWALAQLALRGAPLTAPLANPEALLQERLAPWMVLALGGLVLWRRRSQTWRLMEAPTSPGAILVGGSLLASATLLPAQAALVAGWGGLFVALFGRAAPVVVLVLAVNVLVVLYPGVVTQWVAEPYARTVLYPVVWLSQLLGYPVGAAGMDLTLTTAAGAPFQATVSTDCAGPTTMALFLGLFGLMAYERPLPLGPSASLLLAGVAGTWLQNVLRITALMVAGYHGGAESLWFTHEYLAYVLFPLWYLAFVGLYLWIGGSVTAADSNNIARPRLASARSERP
ncbi:MAG: exosortase/archaeosortase family protein [Chloroflexi bacterium]|nr:exosortase/archaeosortase family protein [Chloroflexota bacterium]